ncbi:hypothetical protein KFL_000390120 [Klebsormidium nitens]|uniref:SANT domain-containing protein n=1 Tax=Klebsormidium nitens TaxID=105231 RepID=A0A1Y1HP54_KLENI|nr:hypothetical protein KFL_000390120 [Klebsormidium nitens]|eukprot:GAQ79823.1 hypothetical protein KFL_000390120 [Klebsormidium nitens]
MSLSSLRVLDKDVTNAPGRDSAFRPNVKARVRRGQTGTPAPEAVPAPQAPPLETTARPEPLDAAQRPAPPSGPLSGPARSARLPPIVEAERPRGREPAAAPLGALAPPADPIAPATLPQAAAPPAADGPTQSAGAKRRIPHSTTGGRRRTAFRGGPEVDEHFLATGEVNTAGMTLKDILRMADAKEKERNVDDVRRPPRDEEAEERQARERSPDEPDVRALAPQIRVVDGQIVVDQQSLTASAQASNPVVSHSYRRVEESGSRLNSNTYSNRKPTKRWTDADTVVFYKALRQFGTDFTTIQKLFPSRSRHQIKNKYLNEDRHHPKAIEAALNHKSKDSSHYEEMIAQLQTAANAEAEENLENGAQPDGAQNRGASGSTGTAQTTASVAANASQAAASGVDDVAGTSGRDDDVGELDHVGFPAALVVPSGGSQQGASQQSTAPTAGGLSQESQARATGVEGPVREAEASGPLNYLQRSMQRRLERGYRDSAL